MDQDLVSTLGRIENKIGSMSGKQDMMLDLMKEDRVRIAAVEKRVWWSGGVWAVLAILGAKFGIPPFPHA
jgi:hypothetical protein